MILLNIIIFYYYCLKNNTETNLKIYSEYKAYYSTDYLYVNDCL